MINSEKLIAKMEKWLKDHPKTSWPYCMTPGYWNTLQFNLSKLGYEIVPKTTGDNAK